MKDLLCLSPAFFRKQVLLIFQKVIDILNIPINNIEIY